MLSILSCASWLFYLPWRYVCSDLLPSFTLSFYYWVSRLVYFAYKSLILYMIYKYLLSSCGFFSHFLFLNFFFSTFIYFWDRERQSMNGGGSEREGDTESETGSRLRAVSTEPDAGLEPTDCKIMHDLSRSRTLNRLSHPGAPEFSFKLKTHDIC